MSTNGRSKRKSKALGSLFRHTFNRPSRSPSPLVSPQSLGSQAFSSELPNGPCSTASNSGGWDLLPNNERPVASQPVPTSSANSAELANHRFTLPAGDTTVITSAADKHKTMGIAWLGLLASLKNLKDAVGVLGPLASATTILVDCFSAIEVVARNQEDYEDLAMALMELSDSLTKYFKDRTPNVLSKCVVGVAMGIDRQAAEIKRRTERSIGRLSAARLDEDELLRHYRRIQSLFQQLQINLSMSMWSITNELLLEKRLDGLSPEKQAAYDSKLSTSINRRTCTHGTREEVLANLVNWVYAPDAPVVYWMNGMAGTGKTTIAYTFAEWLDQHELLAASFFCTRTSADCRDATRIIPTVVYQLARYSASFQSILHDTLSAEPDAGSKNISKQFERLLKEPLLKMKGAMLDNLVVVIDALDECADHNEVEMILDILFRYTPDLPLKFFITSRPVPEICEKMSLNTQSRATIRLHDIESSLVRADIELYLKEELAPMSPSPSDIEQLAERSGALFIYAATLVRYIQPRKRWTDPHQRLRLVLGMTTDSVRQHAQIDAQIDPLYTAVLESALREDGLESENISDIRAVLCTVLLAQEPIGVETIAQLAGIDEPRRVEYALYPLRSVLHQSEATGLVSTLHASFPDFMSSNERSGSYFCDVVEYSQLLSRRCFLVMEEQLRFNICELESSFIPDEKVDDLQSRIKLRISPSLAYACRHWANHLSLAPRSDDLLAMLSGFLSRQLLFWIEVLSLRGDLVVGIEELFKTKRWLISVGYPSTDLALFIEDSCNFMTRFAASPVSHSTPHLYISSLPFAPRSSLVYRHYWKQMAGLLELKGSLIEQRRTAALATWNVGQAVCSVAYPPDGSRVAVGCRDGTISLRNAYDGTLIVGPLHGHTGHVWVVFSPNGRSIASGSLDKTVRIWNAYNGALVAGPLEGHTDFVTSISFSPDGKRIASGSKDHTIRVWSATDGTLLLGPLNIHNDRVTSVAFSPNGALVASASGDHTIRCWNSHNGTPATAPFQGHTHQVTSITFTSDGTRLVSGSWDKTIRVWNIHDGSLFNSFWGHSKGLHAVSISPDGTRVAFVFESDRTVRVCNIDDGALVAGPFVGHTKKVDSIAYSPDGTRVISGSKDGTIRVWNVHDGALLPPPSPPSHAVANTKSVILSPDGSRIISSSEDGVVGIWDMIDGSFTTNPHKARFFPTPICDLSPNTRYIASTSEKGEMRIMDVSDGTFVTKPLGIHHDSLSALRFSPDSTTIIAGQKDGTIEIRAIHTRSVIGNPLIGHSGAVTSVALSPDCALAVSCSSDKTIRVWDILTPTFELDLTPLISDLRSAVISEGWAITKEGWVINSNENLLFWVPSDLAHVWPSPHVKLIITDSGTLEIPKQKLLVGERWSQCYMPR